jgi:hypothetical protein
VIPPYNSFLISIPERCDPSILRGWAVKNFDLPIKSSLFHPYEKPIPHTTMRHHLTEPAILFQYPPKIFIEKWCSENIARTLLTPLISAINDDPIIALTRLRFDELTSIAVFDDKSA